MGNLSSAVSLSPFTWPSIDKAENSELGQAFKAGLRKGARIIALHDKSAQRAKSKRLESNTKPGNVTPQISTAPLPGILRKESSSTPGSVFSNESRMNRDPKTVTVNDTRDFLPAAQNSTAATTFPEPVKSSDNPLNENNNMSHVFSSPSDEQPGNSEESSTPKTQEEVQEREAAERIQQAADIANKNVYRPYTPEAWPTASLLNAFLARSKREPTTVIIARFLPRTSKVPVIIKYSYNTYNLETAFEASDNLYSVLPLKEGTVLGETTEDKIEFFFKVFKTCVNHLQGQIWWNGFSIVVDQKTTKKRLKITGFESDPSQLLFETTDMNNIQVHRTTHKMELRGTSNENAEDFRSFKMRGPNAREIKVSKLRSDLITVHVPEYNSEAIVVSGSPLSQ